MGLTLTRLQEAAELGRRYNDLDELLSETSKRRPDTSIVCNVWTVDVDGDSNDDLGSFKLSIGELSQLLLRQRAIAASRLAVYDVDLPDPAADTASPAAPAPTAATSDAT